MRRLVVAVERDEGREVGALAGQVLGELEAGARRRRIGVDRVVEQAEAVLVAQLLVGLAHIRDFAQVEREAVGVERRTPQLAVGEGAAEQHERVGFLAGVAGALIGDIGGGRGALEEVVRSLSSAGRICRIVRASRSQLPASRGATDDDLRQHLHAGAEIALLKAASASLRSVATGLATCRTSVLIWASSLTALSARSDRWKGLSAAKAVKEKKATSAAAKPARTDASIDGPP